MDGYYAKAMYQLYSTVGERPSRVGTLLPDDRNLARELL